MAGLVRSDRLAIQQSADLVVMGHTHTPVGGLGISPINYFNNGFECASVPDLPRPTNPAMFTFTVVDLDQPAAEIFSVHRAQTRHLRRRPRVGSGAPLRRFSPPAIDFSCYVRILNKAASRSRSTGSAASQGYWPVPPPQTIPAGGRGDGWLQDDVGGIGSAGTFSYQGAGDFSVSCPTGAVKNSVSGAGGNFVAKSGAGDWAFERKRSGLAAPTSGHLHRRRLVTCQAFGLPIPTRRSRRRSSRPGSGTTPTRTSSTRAWTRCSGASATRTATTLAAIAMNMIIDCEPIFFDYDGKHWMIELWKGQYGLETGCEVGVYTRPIGSSGVGYALLDATIGQRPGDSVPSHNLFYDCASDGDRLTLSATLNRDGQKLFTLGPELHWWLTGFKWGVYSDTSQLTVDVSITLKDAAMLQAFQGGIAGRNYPNMKVNGTTVSFTFDKTYTTQPPKPGLAEAQAWDQQIVNTYNHGQSSTEEQRPEPGAGGVLPHRVRASASPRRLRPDDHRGRHRCRDGDRDDPERCCRRYRRRCERGRVLVGRPYADVRRLGERGRAVPRHQSRLRLLRRDRQQERAFGAAS